MGQTESTVSVGCQTNYHSMITRSQSATSRMLLSLPDQKKPKSILKKTPTKSKLKKRISFADMKQHTKLTREKLVSLLRNDICNMRYGEKKNIGNKTIQRVNIYHWHMFNDISNYQGSV